MEKVYNFPNSKLINIRKEFLEYKKELSSEFFTKNSNNIKMKLNFTGTTEEFDNLVESVSLENHLSSESDLIVLKYDPNKLERYKKKSLLQIPTDALKLNTLNESLQLREMQKGKRRIFTGLFGRSPYMYRFLDNQKSTNTKNEKDELIIPGDDVIISIRFYRPFRYTQGQQNYGPNFDNEFIVLGSQYLTDLRDKIDCISNNHRLFDISSNPNQELPKNETNPGFFFITDTFYNDTRDPNNPNYSDVILKWAKEKEKLIDNLETAEMENTKFFDLNIRLGHPQVYQHHGNCEHLFTFSSIQIISGEDNLNRNDYPILKTISLRNTTICNMCGTREYSFIVKESTRQMHDPCHLCRICFENYHYVDGKKVGEFKAYLINPENKSLIESYDDSD